jgi:hypothetical protein
MEALEEAMKKHNIQLGTSSTSSSGQGKSVVFTPHQVVIRDLKYPQHIVATGSVNDITRLYKFDNIGSSSLPSVFVAHRDEVRRLWHEKFGHLNYRSLQNLCK